MTQADRDRSGSLYLGMLDRFTRSGASGPQTFQVYVLRSEDGVWRIDGM